MRVLKTYQGLRDKHRELEKAVLTVIRDRNMKDRVYNIEDLGSSFIIHSYEEYLEDKKDKKKDIEEYLKRNEYNEEKLERTFLVRENILSNRLKYKNNEGHIGTNVNVVENLYYDLLNDIKRTVQSTNERKTKGKCL